MISGAYGKKTQYKLDDKLLIGIHTVCPQPDLSFPTLRTLIAHVDWPTGIRPTIELHETGLGLGQGTLLVRLEKGDRLAVEADRDRCLALLSVVCNRTVSADILCHVEAASAYWTRGDRALANLRLVFSGLPKLNAPIDAYRLRAAEYLLDEGMAPCELMTELGLEVSVLALGKYDPQFSRACRRAAGVRAGDG